MSKIIIRNETEIKDPTIMEMVQAILIDNMYDTNFCVYTYTSNNEREETLCIYRKLKTGTQTFTFINNEKNVS